MVTRGLQFTIHYSSNYCYLVKVQISIETTLAILGTLGIGGVIGSWVTFVLNKNQFKFERLHEKRAEVIAELHKKLLKVQSTFGFSTLEEKYADVIPPIDQRLTDASDASAELSQFFSENRIYFEHSMEQEIEKISKVTSDLYFDLAKIKDLKPRDFEGAGARLKTELIPLIKKIEAQFKEIIGI